MLEATVTGGEAVMEKLRAMPEVLKKNVDLRMRQLLMEMKQQISGPGGKLEGGVLQHRSGKLSGSVHEIWPVDEGQSVRAGMAAGLGLAYARIHEYGGVTAPHEIVPKAGGVLAWMGADGEMHFARRVNHPGSVMPERSYMRSTLNENEERFRVLMDRAVRDTLS